MVYTNVFIVDLSFMQSIKQLRNDISVYGLYEPSVHLSVRTVRCSIDDFLSKGCTCPERKSGSSFIAEINIFLGIINAFNITDVCIDFISFLSCVQLGFVSVPCYP
jgi:hypothetical protein